MEINLIKDIMLKNEGPLFKVSGLAGAIGKRTSDWLGKKATLEKIIWVAIGKNISLDTSNKDWQKNIDQVIKVQNGGLGEQGTYLCKELLIDFIYWLSPKYASSILIECSSIIFGKSGEVDNRFNNLSDEYFEGFMDSVGFKTYIMESKGLYKIGKSSDPNARLDSLRTGNPHIKMVSVYEVDYESKLHELFKNKRVIGEWFRLEPEDLVTIGHELGQFVRYY